MFGILGSLAKAAVAVVVTPVALVADIITPPTVELVAVPEQRQGISEDTLLRALAICQQPALAVNLLGIRPA